MTRTVGLIGYGRFGRLAARYCAREAVVHVHDPAVRVRSSGRVRRASLALAASQPVVILAVPVSSMKKVLRAMRPAVRPGALVVDVCAVKTRPLRWMKKMLPASVSLLGTHPLFGPDSDTGSLAGQRIVVTPGRKGRAWLRAVRAAARRHGVIIHVMTPEAHDRLMAETLLLTQYIGRLPGEAGIPVRSWSTPSYAQLRMLVRTARRDSEELFADMWKYNPYGARTARALLRSHRALLGRTRGPV